MLNSFPPVANGDTTVMMLGSFPGVASLSAVQYYAHPRNQFWPLLGAVLNINLVDLPYQDRLNAILARGVGLWDVLDACERKGSLDAAIRHATPNDFASLRQRSPRLEKLCFNGKTAGRFAPLLSEAGYRTLVLPSSSPAHAAMRFEQKLSIWQGIFDADADADADADER